MKILRFTIKAVFAVGVMCALWALAMPLFRVVAETPYRFLPLVCRTLAQIGIVGLVLTVFAWYLERDVSEFVIRKPQPTELSESDRTLLNKVLREVYRLNRYGTWWTRS
jgi:sensor domain CHASE-containing protein